MKVIFLILFFKIGNTSHEAAHIQFSDVKSCEIAKTRIIERLKDTYHSSKFSVFCISESKEQK